MTFVCGTSLTGFALISFAIVNNSSEYLYSGMILVGCLSMIVGFVFSVIFALKKDNKID